MANRKVLVGFTGFLVVLVAVLGLGMDVMSMSNASADDDKARPDLILIDVIAEQQALEMPAALFLHDKHTEALSKRGKDCTACHKTKQSADGSEVLSFAFMRTEDLDPAALKELYHNGCIGCHAEDVAAKAESAGPEAGECRTCHVAAPEYADARQPVNLNNALHFRHWGSKIIPSDKDQETNCGSCHHEFDKTAQKLVYVKYEEESCGYCHTDTPEGDVKHDRVAAYHAQCVNCHNSLEKAKAEKYGPTQCAGCHGAEKQAATQENLSEMIEKLDGELPRLPRKQPDAALLTPPLPPQDEPQPTPEQLAGLMPVAFNHIDHERNTESCSDCHHKSVKACLECHTVTGAEEGNFISLEQAMHQTNSTKSCVGCHAEKQSDPTCAGCHAAIPTAAVPAEKTCATCHLTVAPTREPQSGPVTLSDESEESTDAVQPIQAAPRPLLTLPLPEDKEVRQALAKELVAARSTEQLLLKVDDIPEKVVIGVLADEYKPSEMPHRKIVLTMLENMKEDTLASVFHATETTVCQGCHHNSPASRNPPSCKSCHGEPFNEGRPGRPGLKAAYHAQCMDCHKQMQLEKPLATDCVACHAKKD
jgi:hypothetical protein